MARRNGWKAEQWIGSVATVEFVPAKVSADDREAGLGVRDVYPDPLAWCACCGTPLWHHWIFATATGDTCTIGTSCAAVILGETPAARLSSDQARRDADLAEQREAAERAEAVNWFRAPAQSDLRRAVIVGARAERQAAQGAEFYGRARKAAKVGAVSDRYRTYIVRAAGDDAAASAARTSSAMAQLRVLGQCSLGRYDGPLVADLTERVMPLYGQFTTWGSPLSVKQVELVEKKAHRYRKQIAKIEAATADRLVAATA